MDALMRLAIAAGIFGLMVGLEALLPKRPVPDRLRRWPINLGLAALNMAVLRVSVGGLAYSAALYAQAAGLGLLQVVPLGQGWAVAASVLLLDCAIYWQHVASHRYPLLWRLHQVHHSDLLVDATTAVRFHPLEILLSMLYKSLCIILIGAEPLAVVAFEVLLNGAATFNHSNIQLPDGLERRLRWWLITPDLHRIHHSVLIAETNSNYGFAIPLWDKLFKTYKSHSQQPQATMPIGLAAHRNPQALGFLRLLQWPVRPLPD